MATLRLACDAPHCECATVVNSSGPLHSVEAGHVFSITKHKPTPASCNLTMETAGGRFVLFSLTVADWRAELSEMQALPKVKRL